MINALNKPSDEKNYADAAAQFAYRAYGFSGDQYNYIVSSIDKQFMEIIKMEMMYQEFIAQRGDYFEEKYPDDESKWESYAAWTNDLNKLNEDVAKAMDTMLDREILVSDSTVGSIRMKLDEFVKPEDMVSVRMKNENYHEKLTGEFYENEQPIIDAFNEGYLYLIEEYGWKSNADVITPFINFHRIAVPTPKTEENPSGIDIYYIFDTSQPHDAEEDWAWNSDDSVPENLRFYQFEEKIDLTLARDQHIPSCDFINLTKENYSDGQNQFSCAKSTAEFQSLFATGLFSALSSIPGDYLSEYLLTKKDTKTYIALSDYDFDYHDAWATSYTIFHVVDTTGQYPGSSLESSTLSAEKIQPDKSAGAYSAYTVILKNRPQEDGYYKTKVDVATNGVGDTELEMVQEDGTICQENIVPSGKEVTLRFKAEGTTVLESITLQRHNNTENPSEVTSEETLLTKDQIATLSPDEEGYYTYTYSAPYSNATFVLNGAVGHKVYVKGTLKNFTLNGTIVTTAEAASAVGGVVGTTSGGVIRRVNSNVNIGSGLIYYIGGIVGFVTDDDTYAGGTKIKDCANYGLITYYKVENHGGRGYSGGITGQVALGEEDFILSDCYNYGSVLAEEWKEIYGAISGYCAAKKDGIKNNYYLDTLPVKGFLGEAELANDEELAKAKTAEQFKSGEEAYLLNKEVTDGSQVWYQNIDNGEIPDAYPVLDDTHGTVYRWEDGTYSNYEKEPVEETYEIRTFKEFKEIPEIVKKNNRANFKLMNTIFGDGETMTESIGSADNPYNGTFDGQGYYVYRFDIKSSDGNAALFDTIGARGSVKNFGAFYQNIEGEKAAGLAIVNYGLIDECISGSNLSGSFTDQLTKEPKNLTETTTFVKGTSMAGGVVVENKGVIRNTANYAKATASASDGIVGGIAVVNSGTIENCMSIGTLSTKENGIAGGIVGKLDKNGSIQIAYSAQTAIEGGTTGAVFGAKEETAGAVNNTYYQDTLSGNEEQGTAKTAAEMKSNAFKEELNTLVAGNEELCSWTWNSTKNQGYPRILSSLITEVELVNASRGLTVKGMRLH